MSTEHKVASTFGNLNLSSSVDEVVLVPTVDDLLGAPPSSQPLWDLSKRCRVKIKMPSSLVVVSPVDAASLQVDADGQPITSPADQALDALDDFNHPRLRRALILQALLQKKHSCPMTFKVTGSLAKWTELYQSVHTTGLLDFLATAWTRWQALADGQDPSGGRTSTAGFVLVPSCMPLPRAPGQRPSQHVIGQMG